MTNNNQPKHNNFLDGNPLKIIFQAIIPIILIFVVIKITTNFISKKRKPKRRPQQTMMSVVKIQKMKLQNEHLTLEAMGKVRSAKELVLTPQVSGQIIEVSKKLDEGKQIKAGELLLKIDPQDYEIKVAVAKVKIINANAQIEKIAATIAIEKGEQKIAKREWEMMKKTGHALPNDNSLALRTPQLKRLIADQKMAISNLELAKIELQKANLDLSRTIITMPFNGIVSKRHINLGSQVSPQTKMATFVGSDQFWLEATIPQAELKWLDLSNKNSEVIIHIDDENSRKGKILRLLHAIEERGRMARILITIDDPLALRTPQNKAIYISNYLKVSIKGRELRNICKIPRSALHNGKNIWLYKQQKLIIKPVAVAWKSRSFVYLKMKLPKEAMLITSELSAPVNGMAIATREDINKMAKVKSKGENGSMPNKENMTKKQKEMMKKRGMPNKENMSKKQKEMMKKRGAKNAK